MAELTTRQVAVLTVAAGALAGAAVAGTVAAAADSGHSNTTSSWSGSSSQVSTAQVMRTDLSTTVQVGGSIGFSGSDTITALGGGVSTPGCRNRDTSSSRTSPSTRSATSRRRCCTAAFPPTGRSMPACPTVLTRAS